MKVMNILGVLILIQLAAAVNFDAINFEFKAFNGSNYPVADGTFCDLGSSSQIRIIKFNYPLNDYYTDYINGIDKVLLSRTSKGKCESFFGSYQALNTGSSSFVKVTLDGKNCRRYDISNGFQIYTTETDDFVAVKLAMYDMIFVKTNDSTFQMPSGADSNNGCPAKVCGLKADIGLSCDGSGSITKTNFANFKNGIIGLIESPAIVMGDNKIRMTLIRFSHVVSTVGKLINNKADAKIIVNSMALPSGNTCIACGLQRLYTEISSTEYNKVYITLTDGAANVHWNYAQAGCQNQDFDCEIAYLNNLAITSANTRGLNADFIGVGISTEPSQATLLTLANNVKSRVINTSWEDFQRIILGVLTETCQDFGSVPLCPPTCKGFCINGICNCPIKCETGICTEGTCRSPTIGCEVKPKICPPSSSPCNTSFCDIATNMCDETESCSVGDLDVCNKYTCDYSVNPLGTCKKTRLYESDSNKCFIFKCEVDANGKAQPVVDKVTNCFPNSKCYDYGCNNDTGCWSNLNETCTNDPGPCKVARCYHDRGCEVEEVLCTQPPCGGEAYCNPATGKCEYTQGPGCPLPPEIDGNSTCGFAYCDVSADDGSGICKASIVECGKKCSNVICPTNDVCNIMYCNEADGSCVNNITTCPPPKDKCYESYCDSKLGCLTRKKSNIASLENKCNRCNNLTGEIEPVICDGDRASCRDSRCNLTTGTCDMDQFPYCETLPCQATICNNGECSYEFSCSLPIPQNNSCYDVGCVDGKCDYIYIGCGYLPHKKCSFYVCNEDNRACEEVQNTQCAVNNNKCVTYKCNEEDGSCIIDVDNSNATFCDYEPCQTVTCNPDFGCVYEMIECGYVQKENITQKCQPLICNMKTSKCEINTSLYNESDLDSCGYCTELGLPCFKEGAAVATYGAPIIAGIVILAVIIALVVAVLVFATSTKVYGLMNVASNTMTGNVQTSSLYEGNETEYTNPQFQ